MNDRPRRSLTAPRRSFGVVRNSTVASNSPSDTSRRHRPDYWLLILSSILLAIGLVVVYSISPGLAATTGGSESYFVVKQLIAIALGVGVLVAAAYAPLQWWKKTANILLIAAAVGSVIVLMTPVDEIYRAHRWIKVGGLSFQVVELIKLAVVVWTAHFLSKQKKAGLLADFNATFKPLLILMAISGFVIANLQSDLGSAVVVAAIILAMAFLVGIPLKRIGLILGVVAMVGVLAIGTSGYRRDRLFTFLHPSHDCQDVGYQACQALIAIGSGGLAGQGLGHGVQAYGYLPEAANDSIFAIMAEKFGFLGMVTVIVIYSFLFSRLKRIIERTENLFNRLLVVGVLAWISTQMIINIGAMMGLLPIKGITLPFVSHGGTSLVFLTVALGIVLQISRYTSYSKVETGSNNEKNAYSNVSGRGLRRAYNTPLVSRPRT